MVGALKMNYNKARQNMIDGQIRVNRVNSPRIVDVISSVPREIFVPKNLEGTSYIDKDIDIGSGRYLMDPMVFSRFLQELNVHEDDAVLDIGCGTGYSTILFAHLAGGVIGIDQEPTFVEQANQHATSLGVVNAAFFVENHISGYMQNAPYNVIFIGGAVEYIPQTMFDQLADGGRLGVVEYEQNIGRAIIYEKQGDKILKRVICDANVKPITGFELKSEFKL
jgi:protein-L-isoaspartate(D-aspartate) O-methyltransferase